MAITPKQQRFAEEYLIDLNASQAAIRAGYSEATAPEQASRLLKNANVRAMIDERMAERSERTAITADYVLEGIKAVTERCAAQGEEFNPPSALKGYELLGKHLKLFTDKVAVEGSGEDGEHVVKIVLEGVSANR